MELSPVHYLTGTSIKMSMTVLFSIEHQSPLDFKVYLILNKLLKTVHIVA